MNIDLYNQSEMRRAAKRARRREIIADLFEGFIVLVLSYLAVDPLCALVWVISGQHPIGNFYLGTITIHILKFFLK